MTTDEILKQITSPKPKPEKPAEEVKTEWDHRWNKKVDSDLFIKSATDYLYGAKMNQKTAAKMCGLSVPTYTKLLNILYTEGKLDGKYFLDGRGIELDLTANYYTSNDRILERISR